MNQDETISVIKKLNFDKKKEAKLIEKYKNNELSEKAVKNLEDIAENYKEIEVLDETTQDIEKFNKEIKFAEEQAKKEIDAIFEDTQTQLGQINEENEKSKTYVAKLRDDMENYKIEELRTKIAQTK